MDSPEPQDAWSRFKLSPQFRRAISEEGFVVPTEVQQQCIPLITGGQQVIGIAQTGTGKSAAYLLPVLQKIKFAQGKDPRALVLVPTKELVLQIADHAMALSKYSDLRILPLYGGVGPRTQVEMLQTGVDLIIATPGRFMELYLKNEIQVKQLKTLVLDEADRMMDMGFMHQLRKIFEVIPSKRQNLLFTATFPAKVEGLAGEFLEFPVKVEITPQATPAQKINQVVYHVPNLKTKISFIEYLMQQEVFNRVMIFTRTKETADNVFKYLDRKGLGPARVIHSNKGQNSRINAMREFKEGKLRVLVSTDVSARGIDVEDVSHVINLDVPVVYEDYVHRIGRTGRAFKGGDAITLATKAEVYHVKKIEKLIREKIPVAQLPSSIVVAETLKEEEKEMAREIDRQKKLEDPEYKGAFHEKKRK